MYCTIYSVYIVYYGLYIVSLHICQRVTKLSVYIFVYVYCMLYYTYMLHYCILMYTIYTLSTLTYVGLTSVTAPTMPTRYPLHYGPPPPCQTHQSTRNI